MPSNLHIFTGNHLDILADALAELVGKPSPAEGISYLRPEIIVVQSKGMQRWISMALARRNGICANVTFPFPNAFLETTFSTVTGRTPESSSFDPSVLTFRIMVLLRKLMDSAEFAPVRRYLSDDPSPLKYYQLSQKIGDVFDQYLVFRPEMIMAWEKGDQAHIPKEAIWQYVLWQKLYCESNELHRAGLQRKLVQRLMDTNRSIANLPGRVSLFGISYLPVFHLQVLNALAYRIPVHLFLLNPCRQYWTDIVSDQQWIHLRSQNQDGSISQEEFHAERGNRLLASWGGQGKRFFGITHQLEGDVIELFEDYPSDTLLGRIQQDILDLIDLHRDTSDKNSFVPDGSLQIHVCHSPMREVEVLHDQLLGILDHNDDLFPGDILVMTPDIATYAPYVHAVFGKTGAGGEITIPYSVADQSILKESRLVEAFLRVLQLNESRFEASRILGLLEYSTIRRRFCIEVGDLPQIESWVRETNIRWGWDGAERKKHGLPQYSENTWRTGLDRLLLGYAMSSGHESLFAGISPHEGIEGSDSQVLGAFVHFVETLHLLLDDIPVQADLHQWFTRFMTIIDLLFEPIETTSHEIQELREVIGQLERIGDCVVDSEKISFEVVHQYLVDNLGRSTYGTGFLTGAVTFCAMLPMRSIPAKVICLLGMQHDAFPQDLREPGFSLIAAEPRMGDRSKRDDDKYLFLEALMCSGRIFYISYIGRDIQDNAAKPPSVLVNELLEYVDEDLGIPIDPLITEHPLQPFSPDYFNCENKRLFSYSKENQEASRLLGSIGEFHPFFSAPIGMPSESWRQCDLNQLARFFAHPIQFLMQQRLGIYFQQTTEPIADIESFTLNPLDHFHASQYLLKAGKEGRAPEKNYRTLQASGQLPHGNVGLAAYEDVSRDVNAFVQTLGHFVPQSEPEIVRLEVELPPFQISGLLDLIYPTVRIIYRLAKLRPKDLLHAFIHHMAMASVPRVDLPRITFLICKDAIWEFGDMDNPKAILEDFLSLYWQGLQVPLPFFAKTSYAYAIKLSQGKKREVALTDALKTWKGGYFNNGESQDPYIQRCFAGENPLTPDFESLATRIFDPLFAFGKQLSSSSSIPNR